MREITKIRTRRTQEIDCAELTEIIHEQLVANRYFINDSGYSFSVLRAVKNDQLRSL